MKIKIGDLKRVIRETVSSLAEAVNVENIPSARSYLGVMKRNAAQRPTMVSAWNEMLATAQESAGEGPDFDVLGVAAKMAADTGLDKPMLSFHFRKMVNELKSGMQLPTGEDLMAAAEEADAARAAAIAAAPKPAYDPDATEREWNKAHPHRGYRSDD